MQLGNVPQMRWGTDVDCKGKCERPEVKNTVPPPTALPMLSLCPSWRTRRVVAQKELRVLSRVEDVITPEVVALILNELKR